MRKSSKLVGPGFISRLAKKHKESAFGKEASIKNCSLLNSQNTTFTVDKILSRHDRKFTFPIQKQHGEAILQSPIPNQGAKSVLSLCKPLKILELRRFFTSHRVLRSSGGDFDDLDEPLSSNSELHNYSVSDKKAESFDGETDHILLADNKSEFFDGDHNLSSEVDSGTNDRSSAEINDQLRGSDQAFTIVRKETFLNSQSQVTLDLKEYEAKLTYGSDFLDMTFLEIINDVGGTKSSSNSFWKGISMLVKEGHISCNEAIERWIHEGNQVLKEDILYTIAAFRMRANYARALEVSDWLMANTKLKKDDFDYAYHLYFLSKVYGLEKAKGYLRSIPKNHKKEKVYTALLMAYAEHKKVQEAEYTIKKCEETGVEVTTSMYNQLLVAYRHAMKSEKLTETLCLMLSSKVKRDTFTYNVLIDAEARKGNIEEMESLFSKLEGESLRPDVFTCTVMARAYLAVGLQDKARARVEELEKISLSFDGESNPKQQLVESIVSELYAGLGEDYKLESMWRGIRRGGSRILLSVYVSMIKAFGVAGKVGRAEEIFKEMRRKYPDTRVVMQYTALLGVYAERGMRGEAEKLLTIMNESNVFPSPATYDILIKMYIGSGEEGLALDTLEEAQTSMRKDARQKPYFSSYQSIMDVFSKKGEVAMAERTLRQLKIAGYKATYKVYSSLLDAYMVAGASPYGFIDRMVADGNIPNMEVRNKINELHGT